MQAHLVTAPVDGVAPALLLSLPGSGMGQCQPMAQYLFNVPEGFSRLVLEHKLRPGPSLRAAFATDASSLSGFGGFVMRLRGEGHGQLHVVGPAGTQALVCSLQTFIRWRHPAVLVEEVTPWQAQPVVYQDEHVAVAALWKPGLLAAMWPAPAWLMRPQPVQPAQPAGAGGGRSSSSDSSSDSNGDSSESSGSDESSSDSDRSRKDGQSSRNSSSDSSDGEVVRGVSGGKPASEKRQLSGSHLDGMFEALDELFMKGGGSSRRMALAQLKTSRDSVAARSAGGSSACPAASKHNKAVPAAAAAAAAAAKSAAASAVSRRPRPSAAGSGEAADVEVVGGKRYQRIPEQAGINVWVCQKLATKVAAAAAAAASRPSGMSATSLGAASGVVAEQSTADGKDGVAATAQAASWNGAEQPVLGFVCHIRASDQLLLLTNLHCRAAVAQLQQHAVLPLLLQQRERVACVLHMAADGVAGSSALRQLCKQMQPLASAAGGKQLVVERPGVHSSTQAIGHLASARTTAKLHLISPRIFPLPAGIPPVQSADPTSAAEAAAGVGCRDRGCGGAGEEAGSAEGSMGMSRQTSQHKQGQQLNQQQCVEEKKQQHDQTEKTEQRQAQEQHHHQQRHEVHEDGATKRNSTSIKSDVPFGIGAAAPEMGLGTSDGAPPNDRSGVLIIRHMVALQWRPRQPGSSGNVSVSNACAASSGAGQQLPPATGTAAEAGADLGAAGGARSPPRQLAQEQRGAAVPVLCVEPVEGFADSGGFDAIAIQREVLSERPQLLLALEHLRQQQDDALLPPHQQLSARSSAEWLCRRNQVAPPPPPPPPPTSPPLYQAPLATTRSHHLAHLVEQRPLMHQLHPQPQVMRPLYWRQPPYQPVPVPLQLHPPPSLPPWPQQQLWPPVHAPAAAGSGEGATWQQHQPRLASASQQQPVEAPHLQSRQQQQQQSWVPGNAEAAQAVPLPLPSNKRAAESIRARLQGVKRTRSDNSAAGTNGTASEAQEAAQDDQQEEQQQQQQQQALEETCASAQPQQWLQGAPDCIRQLAAGPAACCPAPEVVFLGTGSAEPSKYRGASAIQLRLPCGQSVLMDCGEGTLGALCRTHGSAGAGREVASLGCLWVSHRHADHMSGVLSLLGAYPASLPPLLVVGPLSLRDWLADSAPALRLAGRYRFVHCLELNHPEHWARRALQRHLGITHLQCVPVRHCSDAYGLVLRHEQGWSLVYSGDTQPCQQLVQAGRGCTLLIHEATFEPCLEQQARQKRHSTTAEALQVAQRMGAYRCILTHFSQRYPKWPEGLPQLVPVEEAGTTAEATVDSGQDTALARPKPSSSALRGAAASAVAFDGMRVPLALLPVLPALMPAVQAALAAIEEEEEEEERLEPDAAVDAI